MTEFVQPYDYVTRNAQERPNDLAVANVDQEFTWSSLNDMVKRMARELRDRGIEPGDVIGVRLPQSLGSLAMLTIFHEAAIYLPFNLDMATDYALNIRLVLATEPIPGWPAERTIILDNEFFDKIHRNSAVIEQNRYPSEDTFCRYALSTGSTGRPKVMRVSWLATMYRANKNLAALPDYRAQISLVGLRNDGGIHALLAALMTGRTYFVPFNGVSNATIIQRYNIDVVYGSPAQLAELVQELEKTGQRLSSVEIILPTGAQISPVLVDKLRALSNATIANGYGVTEIGPVTRRFSDSTNSKLVGHPLPETELQIVDEETTQPVPDGVEGIIRIRREHMVHEYFNAPEPTAEHFRDGWYVSGDRGVMTPEGLVILGRKSDLINSGGMITDPLVVEDGFVGVEHLKDWAAFEMKDEDGIGRIALAYVANRDINPQKLYDSVFDTLGQRTPRAYFRVSAIPRNETGKIVRRELSEKFSMTLDEAPSPSMSGISAPSQSLSTSFVQPFDHLKRAWKEAQEAPAIIDPGAIVTRRALYFGAKQFAMLLRERGVQPGDIVAFNLPITLQLRFTFGVFHEAAVLAPFVQPMLGENPWGVKWFVTSQPLAGIPEHKQILITKEVMDEIRKLPWDMEPREYPSGDSLMRIAFSSGTTGAVKAIPFTVDQVERRSLDHESRTMSVTQPMNLMPPRVGMGWWSFYASVLTQRPYLVPGSAEENLKLLRRYRVDSVMSSPAQLAGIVTLLEKTETNLPDLKIAQAGGSSLSQALIDKVKKFTSARVMNAYGTTEAGPATLREGHEDDPSYLGELLPDCEAEIVDPETHEVLPDGETGLIRVRRPTMVDGYFNDPEKTAKAWRDGWFYSGDTGYLNGRVLYIQGRTSEVINIGGSKVDPAAIDAHFDRFDGLVEHAAFGFIDDLGIERVGLAYVATEPVSVEVLHEFAVKTLQGFSPAAYWRVDSIPRNELDKPIRGELTKRFAEDGGKGSESVA